MEAIDAIDLSFLMPYAEWTESKRYLNEPAGKEHYRLLAYLSRQVGGTLYDIGTYTGLSALALSANDEKDVVSYDVKDWFPEDENVVCVKNRKNVEVRMADCNNYMEELCGASLIVLDIDPHDGVEERVIIGNLKKGGFRGLLVMDDSHLNPNMEELIKWVEGQGIETHDLTKYGHWSGTCLAVFDSTHYNVRLE